MLYISLRQYEYLVAVAEVKSLTLAAQKLNISQPSLSVALAKVESALGEVLFDRRKGANLEVTPFGHRFVAQAKALLDMAKELETSAHSERPFVIACFEDIAPWYLAQVLAALRDAFPDKVFEGREGRFSQLAIDLAEGRIDIAMTYDVGLDDRFERRLLQRVSPVAFMPCDHPLAQSKTVELSQIADHPVILSSEELSEGYVRTLFDDMNLQPKVVHRTAALEMMRSLAAHGEGIGISYSRPPGNVSYDGKSLSTITISTPQAVADVVLTWSHLRAPEAQFDQIVSVIRQTL
jgi:DNA-binding transcriptional LysR family regulator